jgi:hypothetical protein
MPNNRLSAAEIATIEKMFKRGERIADIAARLGRPTQSVSKKITALGLKEAEKPVAGPDVG